MRKSPPAAHLVAATDPGRAETARARRRDRVLAAIPRPRPHARLDVSRRVGRRLGRLAAGAGGAEIGRRRGASGDRAGRQWSRGFAGHPRDPCNSGTKFVHQ